MKFFPIAVRLGVILGVAACLALPARAESPADVPNPQAARRSFVADNAEVLDASTERQLDDLINGVKRKTGAEIAVVTVRNLGGSNVEDFANQLFNRWGIGRQNNDDGVLILAAIADRKLRIEIGDGAEANITDGQAGHIVRSVIAPRFKAGDFNGGLYNGTLAVAQKFDASLQNASATAPNSGSRTAPNNNSPFGLPDDDAATSPQSPDFNAAPRGNSDGGGASLIGWLLVGIFPLGAVGVVVLILVLVVRSARPPQCPRCKTPMQLLPEFEEDAYLSDVQQLEESLGGREWNVWRCPQDGFQAIMKHDKWLSSVTDCPRCGNRTVTSQSQTLRYATEYQSGLERSTHICHNPQCRHNWATEHRIPRVQPVVIVTGGGGSFGGSSSRHSGSSRSSGGGSFGGGHSSGGGASGGW